MLSSIIICHLAIDLHQCTPWVFENKLQYTICSQLKGIGHLTIDKEAWGGGVDEMHALALREAFLVRLACEALFDKAPQRKGHHI